MSYTAPRSLPLAAAPAVVLCTPSTPAEWAAAREILREYADSLGIDLAFQQFDEELAGLPGDYAEPHGALLLALVEAPPAPGDAPDPAAPPAPDPGTRLTLANGQPMFVAGCCGLRPLHSVDEINAAEMKRLYVRPAFRGLGLGRQLAEAVLDAARTAGCYACVLLDTLDEMESARALYEDLGFVEVPPYYHNPIAGSHYLKAKL